MKDIRSILEGIVSQGRQVGSGGAAFRSASSSGSSGKHDHGVDIGAHRNQAHEVRAKDAAADRAKAREKEVEKRNREAEKRQKETMSMAKEEEVKESRKPGRSLMDDPRVKRALMVHNTLQGKPAPKPEDSEKKKEEVKEDKMSAGTEARTKIKNVARMDDADPKSEKSTLGKTGQIKTKVIDEGKPTMSLPNFGLPASLIAAARQIVEKKQDDDGKDPKKMTGGKTAVELEPETNDKIDEGEPKAKKHTVPKTDKEKKLAALAHPKDKITHKDVLVGRGVVKEEEVEQIDEMDNAPSSGDYSRYNSPEAQERRKKEREELAKQAHSTPKRAKIASKLGIKKEEVEQVDEAAKWRKGPEGKSWKSNPMSRPEDDEGEKAVYGSSKLPNVPAHKATGKITKDTYSKLGSRKSVSKLKYRGGIGFGPKGKLPEETEQVDEVSKATLGSYVKKVAALPPEKVKPSREKGIEMASKKLHKEDVALSAEEEARIAEIAKSFPAEIDEAVKKSNTVPSATTATSSPVRGANQDQSGFGTKSSTADYTISDEKKVRKEEVELDEGRGRPRKHPLPAGHETEGDDTHKHPMQQLEKISHSFEGKEPEFEHKDGSKSKISKHAARHIVAIHNSMRTSQEKDNFAQKVHANRGSMKAEVSKHI